MAPRPATIVAVLAAACALTGCLTGERPTLAENSTIDAPVGDPAVDAVLALFAGLSDAVFTADYTITNNFGPVVRDATVVQADDGRRAITVGDVRFLLAPAAALTCRPDPAGSDDLRCTGGVDDAAISDLQVTHQFYGRSAAQRLRSDAERRVDSTESYTATFADRTAQCVSIPVSGGSKVYCVLPEGILASYQGPDVLIELTGFEPTFDPRAFIRPN